MITKPNTYLFLSFLGQIVSNFLFGNVSGGPLLPATITFFATAIGIIHMPRITAAAAFSSLSRGPIRRRIRGIRIVGIIWSPSTLLSPTAATVCSHSEDNQSRENHKRPFIYISIESGSWRPMVGKSQLNIILENGLIFYIQGLNVINTFRNYWFLWG